MPWDDGGPSPWDEGPSSPSFSSPAQRSEPGDGVSDSGHAASWARPGSSPWHAQSSQQSASADFGSSHSSAADWTATGAVTEWPTPDQESSFQAAAPISGGRTSPPVPLLLAGLGAILVAVGLWFVGGWQINLLGWAIAAFIGLGSAFAFMSSDIRAQMNPWYISNPSLVRPLQAVVIVGAILAAGANAWSFADWLSRQDLFR